MLWTGVAPNAAPGLALFVERASSGSTLLSPSLRLSLSGAEASSATRRGDLLVRLATLRLDGCPLAIGSPSLQLKPCAAAGVGIFAAEGTSATGMTTTDPWFDVAAHARLSWMPIASLAVESQ